MNYDAEVKLSIVIINHNYSEFLTNCIESCLRQKHKAHEIVVVDDGSTDASHVIINRYLDQIKAIYNPQQGHVASLNSGFAHSTGDVCIFLDADDILYEHCGCVIIKKWKSGISKIQYRLDTIDRVGQDQHMQFPYFRDGLTPEEVRRQALTFGVYPWSVSSGNAYSRAFLSQLLPVDVDKIYRSPDGYLNKLAPLYGDVISIKDVLGAYRVHGNNAWAQDTQSVRIAPIIRWLKYDIVLQREFLRCAASKNISVGSAGEIRSLQQLEYRMLACRLARYETPYQNDHAAKLFLLGIKFAAFAPNITFIGRLAWVAWIFSMAFMPNVIVRKIFLEARGQMGRKSWFNRVVKAAHKKA